MPVKLLLFAFPREESDAGPRPKGPSSPNPPSINPPIPVVSAVRVIVLEPNNNWTALFMDTSVLLMVVTGADGSIDIGTPDTVIAAAPGVSVVPATTTALFVIVKAWPSILVVVGFGSLAKVMVLEPTTRMGDSGVISVPVPGNAIGGAPAVRVVPATMTESCPIVTICPSMSVVVCLASFEARDKVLEPTTRTDDLYAIGVPERVMGGAPGVNVVPAMTTAFCFIVKV